MDLTSILECAVLQTNEGDDLRTFQNFGLKLISQAKALYQAENLLIMMQH